MNIELVGIMQSNEKSFHYNKLKIYLHPEVYEPAEDTFLLLESIKINPGQYVFEIGSGTGIIALACAYKGAHVICSDINPYAVDLIKKNILENQKKIQGSIQARLGDLYTPLKPKEQFDVIIFNPPYLPLQPAEHIKDQEWLDIATIGGTDGLQQTKRFIIDMAKYLRKNGCAYTIVSSLSNIMKFEIFLKDHGFTFKVLKTQKFDGESIHIYHLKLKQ